MGGGNAYVGPHPVDLSGGWGDKPKSRNTNESRPPAPDDGHNQDSRTSSGSTNRDLKKGMFDDTACSIYNKSNSDSGYTAGKLITDLQKQLIDMGFLKQDKPDGDFGKTTEQALKDFQTAALKNDRLTKNCIELTKAQSITYCGTSDGICGHLTNDELDLWRSKNWIKPVRSFKKGASGPELQNFQTYLQDIGVYIDRAVDGWFWNKMQEALNQFQEAAEKGKFIINGVLTDIEKLTGHRKGDLCPKTQDYLKMVKDKGGKVPVAASSGFDIDKAVEYLNSHAESEPKHKCANYVRLAISAGGIDTTSHPTPAKDYGPYLVKYGFKEIAGNSYNLSSDPVKGDISVIQTYKDAPSPYGHITMYNGTNWVSDFTQTDMWSGPGYRTNKPDFKIYRWENK